MKKIFTGIFLFLAAFVLFAEPPFPRPEHHDFEKRHRNFNGKRFSEFEGDFKPVVIKTVEIPDAFMLEILFNGPVDPESINPECIKINSISADLINLRFSKKRNAFRLILPKDFIETEKETFDLCLSGVKSITGKTIEPVEFQNCIIFSEYRFSEREKVWKKF